MSAKIVASEHTFLLLQMQSYRLSHLPQSMLIARHTKRWWSHRKLRAVRRYSNCRVPMERSVMVGCMWAGKGDIDVILFVRANTPRGYNWEQERIILAVCSSTMTTMKTLGRYDIPTSTLKSSFRMCLSSLMKLSCLTAQHVARRPWNRLEVSQRSA